jgi:hypothetical protein
VSGNSDAKARNEAVDLLMKAAESGLPEAQRAAEAGHSEGLAALVADLNNEQKANQDR